MENTEKITLEWAELLTFLGLPKATYGIETALAMKQLDLSYNQISVLPESIGLLVNLEYLDCSWNKLTALPDSICLLVNLVELDCSCNKLTALPESLGNLTNLVYLDCGDNRLSVNPKGFSKKVCVYTRGNHF